VKELIRILTLVRNFLLGYHQIINKECNVVAIAYKAYDLEEKKVGTVGAERIRRLLLQRLKPFNCTLLYHDRLKMETKLENQTGAKFDEDLDSILSKCDIVVINMPLI
jgi:formate dehydrogenase